MGDAIKRKNGNWLVSRERIAEFGEGSNEGVGGGIDGQKRQGSQEVKDEAEFHGTYGTRMERKKLRCFEVELKRDSSLHSE